MTGSMASIRLAQTISHSALLDDGGIATSFGSGTTLELARELGEGAFGRVYEVRSVDGVVPPPCVVKVLFEGAGLSPETSSRSIGELHDALARTALPYPARDHLAGVPFWVGTGIQAGQPVHVSISHNLLAQGYRALDGMLEDPLKRNNWLGQPVANRVAAALHLARGLAILDTIGFLHGDINTENLFVDIREHRATLIDFDAGAVAPLKPLTCGKFDEFSAFEIQELMADPQAALARYGPEAERWSTGVTMHFLLFGLGPLFFLRAQTKLLVEQYLVSNTWPHVTADFAGFNEHNAPFHERYLHELSELPTSAVTRFRDFVEHGSTRPIARPSGDEWATSLRRMTDPPAITALSVSKGTLVSGDEVGVRWSTTNATEVWVNGAGPLPATGSTTLYPSHTAPVTIRARNAFGEVTAQTGLVRVFPVPQIRSLSLPTTSIRLAPVSMTIPRAPAAKITQAVGMSGVGDAIGAFVTSSKPGPGPRTAATRSSRLSSPGSRLASVRPAPRGSLRFPRLQSTKGR